MTFRAFLFATLLLAGGCRGGDPAAVRPNVLLLVMDTTRGDRCSVNGAGPRTTPVLEELGKRGTVYRNAWSPAGWTGPAHASLFTGLRPEHHGFRLDNLMMLGDGMPTLAERFREAGYATGCFSNNAWIAPEFGLTRGFSHREALYRRPDIQDLSSRVGHELARRWLLEQKAAGRPWFLFVNDMEPHLPYRPPEDLEAGFLPPGTSPEEIAWARDVKPADAVRFNCGVWPISPRQFAVLSGLYDGEIRGLDREIGTFLGHLRSDGLLDHAILVITADHGENLGDHGLAEHKGSLHRSICHVPLLIVDPSRPPAAGPVTDVVRLEDLFPTLLERCALPVPAEIDGVSLDRDRAGRISRATQGRPAATMVDAASPEPASDRSRLDRGLRAVFDGRYHYIESTDRTRELYDDVADPAEKANLDGERPEVVKRLRALLPAR